MLKKILTINALTLALAVGGVSLSQTSCSQADKKEAAQDTDQAYNNFKTFVDNTEAGAKDVANETQEEYDQQTAKLKADYDSAVAGIDRDADKYDDARRAEIEQLRARYTTAYDAREQSWSSRPGAVATTTTTKVGKYYKPIASGVAAMTAQNALTKYDTFVNMVDRNKAQYDIDDWRNINADWQAMDTRYDQIKDQISSADKRQIAEEKAKYAAFKSVDKTKIRAEQGADAVTGAAKDVAQDAKEVGKDVGHGAANVGKDVGHGAKEVGKDIGHGAAKVGKKVGGAVKGAFKDVKEKVKGDKEE